MLLLPVLGAGVLVTTALAGSTTGADAYGADVGTVVRVAAVLLAVLANVGLLMLAFRVLTATEVPTRDCASARVELTSADERAYTGYAASEGH